MPQGSVMGPEGEAVNVGAVLGKAGVSEVIGSLGPPITMAAKKIKSFVN